jgi:hypothetical protein
MVSDSDKIISNLPIEAEGAHDIIFDPNERLISIVYSDGTIGYYYKDSSENRSLEKVGNSKHQIHDFAFESSRYHTYTIWSGYQK